MIRRKTKSNPTDHDLISKLTVKKSFPDYGTMYEVYLGKRRIGFADIDHGKTEISFVNINEEYRRKGVSSFLYDYIEKDLGRKLKPSADLLDDGKAFWKTRPKKKNPRNDYLLSDLEIRKSISYEIMNDPHILYSIYYRYDGKNNLIGKFYIKLGSNSAHMEVHKDFRRQGIASYVYDYIERDLNIKLKPNSNQLEDGKEFWKARLKKND